MNATNYRNRVLKLAAGQLGLPKLTFQVIRPVDFHLEPT